MPESTKTTRRFHLAGLTAAGVVTIALVTVLIIRGFIGGPDATSAATARSALESQRAIDEAIRLAQQRMLEQRPDLAEAALRNAANEHPADAELRIQLGEALFAQDRVQEAYEQYNEALGLGPDNAELQFAAGTLASMAGLVDRAAQHYSVAQTLDQANAKYPLYLAQVQRKLGRTEEAQSNLVRVVNLVPDLAVAWGSLADIAFAENNLQMASHYLGKALEIEPDAPSWLLLQARILRREGKPEDAAILLSAIAENQPVPDPMVLREQALCMGLLGRQADAAALYDRAIEVGHPNADTLAELHYEAALWHERLGNDDRAAACAQRAVELGEHRAGIVVQRLAEGS